MRRSILLPALLFLTPIGLEVAAQDGLHPALADMGSITVNDDCGEAPWAHGLPEALSAATRVVVRTDGDWEQAAPAFEALAAEPRFADCVSQQVVAAVALRAVLLDAPPEADGAVAAHLDRLIANEGVAIVAMVEALDRVRDDLPGETARAYERVIVERYREHAEPDCDECVPAAPEALRYRDGDRSSVLDRMAPERRAEIEAQIVRHVAASARIAAWAE